MDSVDLQAELERCQILLWLAAEELVYFCRTGDEVKAYVLANDLFAYACAESVHLPAERAHEVKDIFERFGSGGVDAWCAVEEESTPIKERQTEEYHQARSFLHQRQIG